MAVVPLKPADLYRRCDPEQFDFDTTAELQELEGFIGQPRAVDAVRFGIGVRRKGYNLFALGPAGTGKYALVSSYLKERATVEETPNIYRAVVGKHARSIVDGRPMDAQDALHNLELVLACYRSADQQGRVITLQ